MTEKYIGVDIKLNFMERDTLIAILDEIAEIKKRLAEIAVSAEEKTYCRAHAKIAKEIRDKIYEQKVEEWEKTNGPG